MGANTDQIIKCPSCGQLNKIKGSPEGKRPICAKCWTSLPQSDPESTSSQGPKNDPVQDLAPKGTQTSKKMGWIIALVIGGFLFWVFSQNSAPPSRPQGAPSPPPKTYVAPSQGATSKNADDLFADIPSKPQVSSSPSYPPVSRPKNGHAQVYTKKQRIAPLKISTDNSSDFLVKLVDISTNSQALNVFVKRGSTIEIAVPLGVYEIRYASGDTWYGYDHLFGPETSYNKADELFEFKKIGDRVSGYTVTLYRVVSGNLSTSRINQSQF